ncbi:hypothetical protein D3C76_1197990 [compost metagenome]
MAHAIDVVGVGNVLQRGQHARRHIGITPRTVCTVDDAEETVVGVHHQASIHVRRLGRQVRAVARVIEQIRSGLLIGRRQHQRRIDDVPQQYTAHLQAGLIDALAPLHQVVTGDPRGQVLAEAGLLGRRKIAVGQGHRHVGRRVPGLVNRCRRARHDGGVGGPLHRRPVDRASRGEAKRPDGAAPVLGVIGGLVVTGGAGHRGSVGGATPPGAGLGGNVAQGR